MLDKRGQFFILTAVILSTVVLGLTTVENYAEVSKEPTEILDLMYEIEGEKASVIDYGVYSSYNELEDFVDKVIKDTETKYPEKKIVVFYEDKSGKIKIKERKPAKGTVTWQTGENAFHFGTDGSEGTTTESPWSFWNFRNNERVRFTVGEGEQAEEYTIQTQKGKNFYFVIETSEEEG